MTHPLDIDAVRTGGFRVARAATRGMAMRWTIGDVTVTKVVELVQPLPAGRAAARCDPARRSRPTRAWLRAALPR